MMEYAFFSDSSNKLPTRHVADFVELSFDAPTRYDWGTPILSYLYHSLDHQCVVRSRCTSITKF